MRLKILASISFNLEAKSMTTLTLPPIPVCVMLACLQEYNRCLYDWQAHAEGLSREIQSLRGRNTELQKEVEEMRDCRDILQRMVDVQRELQASLEADLRRVHAECQNSPGTCNHIDSCPASTPSPLSDLSEMNSDPITTIQTLAGPTELLGEPLLAMVDAI